MCAISERFSSEEPTSSSRHEALGHQELGVDLVDVERLHEHVRALGGFLLPTLGFFLLGDDVDLPAGQLRCEAHGLATPTDGQRQLALGADSLDAVEVFVEHDLVPLGGRQDVDDEARRIRVPLVVSTFSPCGSLTTAWTREPRMPREHRPDR